MLSIKWYFGNVWFQLYRGKTTTTTTKSHHSCPYNKKNAEQTENQWLFLEPSETEVVGWATTSKSGDTEKYR